MKLTKLITKSGKSFKEKLLYLLPIETIYVALSLLSAMFFFKKVSFHIQMVYYLIPQIEDFYAGGINDPNIIGPYIDVLNTELNYIYLYFFAGVLAILVLFILFQSLQYLLSYYKSKEVMKNYFTYLKKFSLLSLLCFLVTGPLVWTLFTQFQNWVATFSFYNLFLLMLMVVVLFVWGAIIIYLLIYSLENGLRNFGNMLRRIFTEPRFIIGFLYFKLSFLLIIIIDFLLAKYLINNYTINLVIVILLFSLLMVFNRFVLINLVYEKL